MFETLSTYLRRADSPRRLRLITFSHLRRPSNKTEYPVFLLLAGIFALGASIDLVVHRSPLVSPNFIMASACLVGALGCLMPEMQRHLTLWIGYAIFWAGETLLLARTGGGASPLFGSCMLILFLLSAWIFVRIRLEFVFFVVGVHFLAWIFISGHDFVGSPMVLNVYEVTGQNGIILFAAFCTVLHFIQMTDTYARKCELQARRLTEARNHLAHSERISEMGQLVATTAHELGQPTQVIISVSSILKTVASDPSKQAEVHEMTGRLMEASHHLYRIVNQLREFSRKEPFILKKFDLGEAIRSVELLNRYDLRWSKVMYETNLADCPLWIYGDSLRIQQIFFNLVNNARDACSGVENPVVRMTAMPYRNWIRVMVWNNGEAIPLQVQKNLFQPYFTTKSREKGTGLGLTVCQQLVEQHGGRILFCSGAGDTCFVIDLPQLQKDMEEEVECEQALAY